MRAAIVLALLLRATCAQAAVAHVGVSGNGVCNSGFFGNMSAACVSTASTTFTYTAGGTNNAVLFSLACASNPNTPSAVSLTASGWTTTQIGTIVGGTAQGWGAMFKAYSPNTSAATFTVTWTVTGSSCNGFMNDLIDEFSGIDLTNFVDASVQKAAATGTCPTATAGNGVTPTVNDDGIWFACNDNVTVIPSPYTKGGDDNNNDWSEWKILTGGSGTEQFAALTGGTTGFTMNGVAIKPAGAATGAPNRMLLGVGKAAP